MKLISWNIDSLNAALTSDSNRAHMSRDVLETIISYDADDIAIQEIKLQETGPSKKNLSQLEEYLPAYDLVWRSTVETARKGHAGTMFLYKNHLNTELTHPTVGAPETKDDEGRIITLE